MSATDRSRARLHSFLSRTRAAKEGRLGDTAPPRRKANDPSPRANQTDPYGLYDEDRLFSFILYMTVAFGAGFTAMLCGKLMMFHAGSDLGLTDYHAQLNGSFVIGAVLLLGYAIIWRFRSLIELGAAFVGFLTVALLEPSIVASFPNVWANFFSETYAAQIAAANPDATPWMWDIVRYMGENSLR